MRVSLSYSVELEDVPDSVADLIADEAGKIDSVQNKLEVIIEALRKPNPHLGLVSKEIDRVRQSRGALDTRLRECTSILSGYEQALDAVPRSQSPAEDQQFDGS